MPSRYGYPSGDAAATGEGALLAARCRDTLGDPQSWHNPVGYPGGLALCLLDCVWSLGIHYDRHVVPVLDRYRAHQRDRGTDPDHDGASDLVAVIDRLGGPDRFAETVGTRHRTSTRAGAPLKAEAVLLAARALAARGVETPADLLDAADAVKPDWRRFPGQRSSDTGWRYLLLLAGADEVKPDRMICRFLARALGRSAVAPEDAAVAVRETAGLLGVPVRVLDHAIWRWESGRR